MRRLRDEPATFWMGVALVSEAPVLGFGHWLLHYHCVAGAPVGCDLKLPLLALVSILVFAATAWLGNRLGLGAPE